jgi:putative transcriptional regulator
MATKKTTKPIIELKLYDIIKARGISVRQLSEMTGMTRAGLYLILNREPRSIGLTTMARICNALEIEPNDLLELKYVEVPK